MSKSSKAAEAGKIPADKLIELKAKWAVDLGLDQNPVAQHGAPISFTAHLDNLLPGQSIPLSTSGLANGFRMPYYLDEIRMQVYMTTATSLGAVNQPSYAAAFQFRTGTYAFSAVPVPMILHQPPYVSSVIPSQNVSGYVLESTFTGAVRTIGDEARWALPKPLWMAPGDQVQATVARDLTAAAGGSSPWSVDVTYVGRTLKPGTLGPKTRCVPWIAHYIHDFADSYSQATTQFRNPFTFPLTIQKLIGRPMSKASVGTFTTGRVNMLPNAVGDEYAAIYIEDSMGYKITRSAVNGIFTPVGSVFDTERCSWTFSRPLGAREQLNMQFQTQGTVAASDRIFGVSMIGYREETA